MSMVCEDCGQNPATVHYTEVVNNEAVSMHLCRRCADEKGFEATKGAPMGLGDLVAGLIDTTVDDEADRIGRVQCPECGYDYSEFKRIGRLGCPACYDAFTAQLVPVIRHVHGSVDHRGKVPEVVSDRATQRAQLSALREELSRAIETEEYERAATLRDEIRTLETGGREEGEQ